MGRGKWLKYTMCAPTGKRSYRSRHDAMIVVRRRASWGGRRVYECADCGGWHVTSMRKAG